MMNSLQQILALSFSILILVAVDIDFIGFYITIDIADSLNICTLQPLVIRRKRKSDLLSLSLRRLRDHGCHAMHSVFSKTAKDLPAHVTTASRLTCYYGDKSTNENSADGCDVDCKLFVLRVTYFFYSYSDPLFTHARARTHTHIWIFVYTKSMHTNKTKISATEFE